MALSRPGGATRSPLSFRQIRTARARGSVVALHGYGGDCGQLAPLAGSLGLPFDWTLPEALRTVVPYTVASADNYGGYAWCPMGLDGAPDLVRLGDSLWCLEQFVLDTVERQPRSAAPLFLLGYDQGASLALLLAGVMPEYLSGVAAIFPPWTEVEGWSLPADDLDGLPVLVVADETALPAARADLPASLGRLTGAGAEITLAQTPAAGGSVAALPVLAEWFNAQFPVPG